MEHSITARYASRPAARFVRASGRARERRLGLRSFGSFQPAPARPTVLRRSNPGPLVSMRGRWRAIAPAGSSRSGAGAPRPAVVIHWTDVRGAGSDRRAGAAPAPWRG
jgi:hypothetical protein